MSLLTVAAVDSGYSGVNATWPATQLVSWLHNHADFELRVDFYRTLFTRVRFHLVEGFTPHFGLDPGAVDVSSTEPIKVLHTVDSAILYPLLVLDFLLEFGAMHIAGPKLLHTCALHAALQSMSYSLE